MKRYLLFFDCTYYPACGWQTLITDFDELHLAIDAGANLRDYARGEIHGSSWFQVVDIKEGIIAHQEGSCYSTESVWTSLVENWKMNL